MMDALRRFLASMRPAFSRRATYGWFVIVFVGFLVRSDTLGVSSIIRALMLAPESYAQLLHFFHSTAWTVPGAMALWWAWLKSRDVAHRVGDRVVLLGDHTKVAKDGRKMPAVATLHQDSETASKPSFFRGHHWGCIALLVRAGDKFFATPLWANVQEGLAGVVAHADAKRPKTTRIVDMAQQVAHTMDHRGYLVLDAYFAVGPVFQAAVRVIDGGVPLVHVVTRAKKNIVGYQPAPVSKKRKRGRPRKYGKKLKLMKLFDSKAKAKDFRTAQAVVYGRRESAVYHQPDLPETLEGLVEPLTRGDPMSPLRWTCKSTRRLSPELTKLGYSASSRLVGILLHGMGYSLQGNRKTIEGRQHPDRNAQFEYINARVTAEMRAAQPVISVDTKKKELIGNYKNGGCEWHRKGEAPKVNGHDFPSPDVPRAHPYGVYDLARNSGFVNVGTDHDTGTSAVASIRKWWLAQGRRAYPKARRLLITADAGGSNGSRLRLWKWELQRLADELRFPISVCHFPPGTSKWNKVEHRLFSFISSNWRGEPLADYATVVNLIAKTTTTTGLKVSCRLDRRRYPTGRRISDEEWAKINLHRNDFHGDWNYTIQPRRRR